MCRKIVPHASPFPHVASLSITHPTPDPTASYDTPSPPPRSFVSERGITILAKNLAVMRDGLKINIMDTPGHADFGGEVERVLNMCDGVLLVVDSVEGPKPQTRFVLDKALKRGMKVLVVVNKIDRPAARPVSSPLSIPRHDRKLRMTEGERRDLALRKHDVQLTSPLPTLVRPFFFVTKEYVVDKVFDLMMDLGASDEQIDFTTVYASGLQGISGMTPTEMTDDMKPLFDAVKRCIDPPKVETTESNTLQCLVSNIDYDQFKGKMGIARITNGSVRSGQAVSLARPGKPKKTGRLSSLFVFDNLGKREVETASAGEIIMFSGLDDVEIGDTLITNEGGGANAAEPLPPIAVELPTVQMTLGVNKSPLAGREGKFLTSRMIRDRLFRELDKNVALKVSSHRGARGRPYRCTTNALFIFPPLFRVRNLQGGGNRFRR
jgi:GTP-binding protein